MILLYLFLPFVFIKSSEALPVVIKTAIGQSKATLEDANKYGVHSVKGLTDFEDEVSTNNEGQHKLVKAHDQGNYAQENSDKQINSGQSDIQNGQFHNVQGGQQSDLNRKTAHKKGHHKSGFSKTYYKDEAGTNTSYYDDSDDEGGEYERTSKNKAYGDSGHNTQREQRLDDHRFGKEGSKNGYYEDAGNYEKGANRQHDLRHRKYYDDRENVDRAHGGNRYSDEDRYVEERYAKVPPPLHKTITIYEDPRYVQDYPRYDRYESRPEDHIRLDVRRPPPYIEQGYHPTYDYYY